MPDLTSLSKQFMIKVFKGALFLMIGIGAVSATNMLFKYFLMHKWGPEIYGTFSLIVTITGILVFFSEFNLNSTATIFIARDPKSPEVAYIIRNILITFFGFSVITLVASYMICALGIRSATVDVLRRYYWYILPLVFLTGLNNIFFGILRANKKMNYEAMANIFKSAAMIILILMVIVLFSGKNVQSVLLILLGSQCIVFTVVLILVHRIYKNAIVIVIRPPENGSFKTTRHTNVMYIMLFSFSILSMSMLITVLSSVDQMMINDMLTVAMVGIYASAFIIIAVPKLVTSAVSNALVPFIAEKTSDKERAKKVYLNFLVLFSLLAAVGYILLIVLAPLIVNAFYPERYDGVQTPLRLLLVSSFFADIFTMNATFIAAIGATSDIGKLSITLLLGVVINIIINFTMIPRHGIVGASITAAVTFLFVGLVSTMIVLHYHTKAKS